MIFKNTKFYSLTQPLTIDPIEMESNLMEAAFQPCGKQDTATMGWSAACPGGKMFTHHANGYIGLRLKKQEKILPSSVINAELADRIEHIEQETGSPVGKKAQQDLKQEIIFALLPQAFVRDTCTYGVISPSDNLVIIDSSNDGKAEAFLALLRKSLGSLPVVPLARHSLQSELTRWLTNSAPDKVELLEEAEFKSTDDLESFIRCKNQPLDSDEITGHLDSGKLVQRIGFTYDEVFSSVLDEDGSLKRIKFSDRLCEEVDDIPKDQVAARFDAEMVLFTGELIRFVDDMREALNLNYDDEPQPVAQASDNEATETQTSFFDADGKDSLQDEAVKFVQETRRASPSAIQRKFRIGFNRAARIIEQMEADGIVSKPGINGNRDVLLPAA